MPELPEVQSVVDELSPVLTGLKIVEVSCRRGDMVSIERFRRKHTEIAGETGAQISSLLLNRTITRIFRRAKRVMVALDDGSHLYIHLGMTGNLEIDPKVEAKHTHIVLKLAARQGRAGKVLAFSDPRRFGQLVYLPVGRVIDEDLGPEPLELTSKRLGELLCAAKRPLKSALLDQRLIAGLGNIYVDESLHAARIHPLQPCTQLTAQQADRLCRSIKQILKQAIAAKGSTLRDYRTPDGSTGSFQKMHRVYDRMGQPCHRCRTPVARILLSGRSTHFCPACQIEPSGKRLAQ